MALYAHVVVQPDYVQKWVYILTPSLLSPSRHASFPSLSLSVSPSLSPPYLSCVDLQDGAGGNTGYLAGEKTDKGP